ncbi:protein SMAX1-LIKE 4-like [Cornus florida]|uniref:protein SMAX1-LIKE 4-like n=1 Tax=Cornus florida TaxID=4283 RepID=UPI002896FE9A|nr:protein SMAX1-LIKE 4-like [Cornus florida]
MRAGACTLPQTLTTEAASVLKHSLALARRRGHAQVTPLHVATTLLSSRASLLRRACLKSQPHQTSHPLQCRALELCFNVALNRLPTTPGPLLHGQSSLSNALIAALKRAQAHQRRGCIEQQQQQPLLAIKVEIEQLILSILDDPSVSRVMKEAGFSSTAVKNNLEDSSASSVFQCYNSSSGGVYSSPCSPSPTETPNPTNFWHSQFLTYTSDQNPLIFSPQKKISTNPITDSASLKEDIKLVLEVLSRKKRKNTVIVGDSVSITEGLVAELMSKIERKEVPEELKSVRFVKFQFSSPLRMMKREVVEQNLLDLKRKVDSFALGGVGVIIYTGDLKWTLEPSACEVEGGCSNGEVSGYSPIDHLVAELGRLLCEYSSSSSTTNVWLMATANYQTYMKCQMKQPPLEIQWALQAVSVPSGGLGLSLHATSVHDSRIIFPHNPSQELETKPFISKEEEDKLTCCAECSSNYEKEAGLFKSGQQKPSSYYLSSCNTKEVDKGSTHLPCWLQSHGAEPRQKDYLFELKRKWNRLCQSLHQGRHTHNHPNSSLFNNQGLIGKGYSYASSYPWWPNQSSISPYSNSISFADSALKPSQSASSLPRFRRQQSCHIEFSFSNGNHKHQPVEPSLDSLKNTEGKEVKITLALGNSLFSDAGKLAQSRDHEEMCKFVQENVPWQAELIPSIVKALIDSKSIKKESWLLIEGNDIVGKRRLARAIAESMFGSVDSLFCINMRNGDHRMSPSSEVLERAFRNHEKLVVLVEDVDFADAQFIKFLADGFETGKFGESSKREGDFGQTIFILTKGEPTSYEDDNKSSNSVIQMKLQLNETIPNSGTSSFDHKRKAEWELPNKAKSPRMNEKEHSSFIAVENGNSKKEFTRQLSSNTLDLNIRADEDEEDGSKPGDLSPISSDLTRETGNDLQNPVGFLELINNRFIFDWNSTRDGQMREMFLFKIKGCFEEVFGSKNLGSFTVEEMLLEEVLFGSGCFLNSLFEKWLENVFQTSLQTVKIGGKENMSVRLCFGGKGESSLGNGFMGSSLPKKIQFQFMG